MEKLSQGGGNRSPRLFGHISSCPHPTIGSSFQLAISTYLPSGSTVYLRKPPEDDAMVLVAPESEFQVSQLPTLVFAGGVHYHRSGSRQQRGFVPAFLFPSVRTVGSIVLLTAADEVTVVFIFMLTPTALLAAAPPHPALGTPSINFGRCFPHLDFEGAGWGLWFYWRCRH